MTDYKVLSTLNRRFCGAIHSADWACIRVLLQVIHSVNEKKNCTDKYYFLCELWRWDSNNHGSFC
ncbi:hypothetical protein ROSEINA2194_03873 [Roseburia inulinivorans DSM 16841]|uniref:Uncharacterized protein n=1 Tax=Roseburia inulinivorans DSM 16841 TaxID=622312 RepID=C0FYN4_9FIRM|nr:hypothetical protein ROSEINA2194_03873 [Roseburia inulinivorans DSM 16841]